jgi:predicted nucleic acid-binding protein
MNYLLDTCVLSELRRKTPNPGLLAWLGRIAETSLSIPATVLGEIQQGITQLRDDNRRDILQAWLDQDLVTRFSGRILNADLETMLEWGVLIGEGRKNGTPRPVVDCLIAATTIRHNLTLVTRNTNDFTVYPLRLVNPWSE